MTRSEALYILGLKPDASVDEAKKAWRNLVKLTHPDKDRTHDAARLFEKVQTAYKTIIETEAIAAQERRERKAREEQAAQRAREEYARRQRAQQRVRYAQAARQHTSRRIAKDYGYVVYYALAFLCFVGPVGLAALFTFLDSHSTPQAIKSEEADADSANARNGKVVEGVIGEMPTPSVDADASDPSAWRRDEDTRRWVDDRIAAEKEAIGEEVDIETLKARVKAYFVDLRDKQGFDIPDEEIANVVEYIDETEGSSDVSSAKPGEVNEAAVWRSDPIMVAWIDSVIDSQRAEGDSDGLKERVRIYLERLRSEGNLEATDAEIANVIEYIDENEGNSDGTQRGRYSDATQPNSG